MNAIATVVIPAHNAEKTLARQLDALANQTDAPDFEVVVVLNRCTDGSSSVARSFASRICLRVVEADRLPSAAYARNIGAADSFAPFLLFCDADDRVARGWVAGMVSALQTGVADFVGGLIVVDRDGLPDWIYRWRYEFFDGRCMRVRPGWLPYTLSASLGCTRMAFEAVGGFDEAFVGAASEEVDLAARLLRAGFRIGEAPDAVMSYRPRTTMREVLRQARGSERGSVALEAKEGRLGPPLSRLEMARQLMKTAGHHIVRQREWRPHVVYCLVMARFYKLEERRRWSAGGERTKRAARTAVDFVAPISTPLIGGLALSARPAQARWYASVGIEQHSLALVEALLPEGGVFVDCGANIGVFTLPAALRVGPKGGVIAFEPDPRSRSLLEQMLFRHNVLERVDVRAQAVGDVNQPQPFHQYDNDPLSGLGFAPECFSPGEIVDTILVDVVTLTDALNPPVDMVKIDVEGFEPAVLRGAAGLLDHSPEAALIVELNPAALRSAGQPADGLLRLVPPDRWSLWLIDEQAPPEVDAIRPFDQEAAAFLASADPSWYGNLLAVPIHHAEATAQIIGTLKAR